MRGTSRAAYANIKHSGVIEHQTALILKHVKVSKYPITRREIAKSLNMETSTASARVNELIKRNQLTEDEKRICSVSLKRVNTVKAVNV